MTSDLTDPLSEPTLVLQYRAELTKLRSELIVAQADIEQLRRQLSNTVAVAEQDLAVAQRMHEGDIKLIGDQLIEEAEGHDLCEAYDDVIRAVNKKLKVKLREREVSYEVSLEIIGDFSATSHEAAGDGFREQVTKVLSAAGIHVVKAKVLDTSY